MLRLTSAVASLFRGQKAKVWGCSFPQYPIRIYILLAESSRRQRQKIRLDKQRRPKQLSGFPLAQDGKNDKSAGISYEWVWDHISGLDYISCMQNVPHSVPGISSEWDHIFT